MYMDTDTKETTKNVRESHLTYTVRYVQLRKMNIAPLAVLGVKWPFSKGRGR